MKRITLFALSICLVALASARPTWKSLPIVEPEGQRAHTGSHIVPDPTQTRWQRPRFVYNGCAATGRKESKVIVIIYDPVLHSRGGVRLTEYLNANCPVQYSRILANVIRDASWGYINYNIVDIITVDGFTKKVDGFRYDEHTFLAAREKQEWQPAITSYRSVIEENNLMERIQREKIREIWLWGSSGMHWDEFAMRIPNRYARFAPTDNPWFYRPYDIPEEIGHTFWVMGFNYEVGADNMVHSYVHRIESMAALAYGQGIWDTHARRDPWNVFSWLEMDHPGTPSMVGNCHVPPNGQSGYDYNNRRRVLSWADNWSRFPDLRGEPREVSSEEWHFNHHGYMAWILGRIPKFPGYTEHGYNNWWVHIANTDEDLPDYRMQDLTRFRLPEDFPPPRPRPRLQ